MEFFSIPFPEMKDFLNEKVEQYNRPEFIETDPIQIPKSFSSLEDMEISGFLSAVIAWGQRKSIIKNAQKIMLFMDNSPYDFIKNHSQTDLEKITGSIHRTFNSEDLVVFIKALQRIYNIYGSIENAVFQSITDNNLQNGISNFKKIFFAETLVSRSYKHLPDPQKGSCAKRINMFFRWMVRSDNKGVDLGIWKKIKPSQLSCPLDVHSGNVARALGLISRKQNDATALAELDKNLRLLDASDPVKYDFALFGLGIFENFSKK
ncbi:MAG: TIGR02757 family protein [Capnocytophaga sp.]|nr:TIGR02757 family protein [Capnocytophaga sp.]